MRGEMPPAGRKAADAAATAGTIPADDPMYDRYRLPKVVAVAPLVVDGVPGKPAHPEYVAGYTIGHADGHDVGFAAGRSAGLTEDTATLIADADRAGYQRGRDDERAAKRPPLFEAAKRLCEQNFDATDDEIDAALAKLAESYQEKLSTPDLALLAGIVRRRRQAAEAQRQIALQIPRPRSQVGQEVAKRLAADPDSRSQTTYETVR